MNSDVYKTLFKLLSLCDESDVKIVVSALVGHLLAKGKIALDDMEEFLQFVKEKD